jgi:protease I
MPHILILLPQTEFDPTEVAVPWKALTDAGHSVTFATQTGAPAVCDQITLTGDGLPMLAASMKARPANRTLYEAMIATGAYQNPISWAAAKASDYDAFHFPGGHAPGMKPYLESPYVQQIARDAFAANKPVAAICHGVIVLTRADVLKGRKTTALTGFQEGIAVLLTKGKLGNHYRTYPVSVENEVKGSLTSPDDFSTGPMIPRFATEANPGAGFIVRDGNYVSARWPGDAWTLATEFCRMLK